MSKEIVFLFPGQGAQFVGMGRDFYQNFKVAREVFEKANEVLGYDLTQIIFEGPKEQLTLTKYSQAAIFVTSMAILKVIQEEMPEIKQTICAGLSLGEYTALCASGKLSFRDCLRLVQARADYMQEASEKHPGSLSVVLGMEEDKIREHIKEKGYKLWIANLNCPGQVVISGSLESLEKAALSLKEAGAKRVLPLDVSGAFHSGLMKLAQEKLQEKIEKIDFLHSNVEIAMNVPGAFVSDSQKMRDYLIDQVASTTLWEKSIRKIAEREVLFYLEIGPGKTLSGMNKKIAVAAPSFSIETIEDLKSVKEKIELEVVK